MPEPTFHSLRISALEHGRNLASYAEEIGVQGLDLESKLLKHAAASLVAVIGDREVGKTALIMGLADISSDELPREKASHTYFHHADFPPIYEGMPEEASFFPSPSGQLKKLSYLEVRTEADVQQVRYDQSIMGAEGLLFIIDAQEPWSGTLWKQVELYQKTHKGRFLFCLMNTEKLNPKDIPVLEKHLKERIKQVSKTEGVLIKMDYGNLFTFQEIRVFMENKAIGEHRWNELRALGGEFQKTFQEIEKVIVTQREWLESSNKTTELLREELLRLRNLIRVELLKRIERMGGSLKSQADEILSQVRSKLSYRNYLGALFKSDTSLMSFQQGLEGILSEALYAEVGSHYMRANELVSQHSERFFAKHKFLARYCPALAHEKASESPFFLEKHIVKNEIQVVLRQLRLKPLFRQELSQIDEMTNARLCLAMIFVMVAGVLGSFLFHTAGFILLGLAVLCVVWCFWARKRALDEFFAFLDEWFLGVGARLLEPMDKLSTSLVDYAIDDYGNCFVPYLEAVKTKQELMPERIKKGRDLYVKNQRFIEHFQKK